MRPLPIEAVRDLPAFVLGLSVIRGSTVPVVDLSAILGTPDRLPASRFVLLRLGSRRIAVAASRVVGIRQIDDSALQGFPPLLHEAFGEFVGAISISDREFLFVLQAAHIVPEEVWRVLDLVGALS